MAYEVVQICDLCLYRHTRNGRDDGTDMEPIRCKLGNNTFMSANHVCPTCAALIKAAVDLVVNERLQYHGAG